MYQLTLTTYTCIFFFFIYFASLHINLWVSKHKKDKTKKVLQKKPIYSIDLCDVGIMNSNFLLDIDFFLLEV